MPKKKRAANKIDSSCTTGQVLICNGVKQRVNREQAENLINTGRHMSVGLAINKLLRKLIDMENENK